MSPPLVGEPVGRSFGSVIAVTEVDVSVAQGEVVGLVGANGAGKTTLIRVLLGLLTPTAGRVELFGGPPDREARRRVGYVPQSGGLYEDLTVAENLAFSTGAYGFRGRTELPGDLSGVRDVLVSRLSLGLRRRVAFANALAHDPELLVLDEPTSGVDPLARAGLWDTIRASAEAGAGVLVTTHYMREAGQCDRLVVLQDGRVAASGALAAIVADTLIVEVRAERWQDAFEVLDAAGWAVGLVGRSVRVVDVPLETVRARLERHGVRATVEERPGTLDETFVRLARTDGQSAASAASAAGPVGGPGAASAI